MKQPFNLSQEKIDQIFWHCILNLSPKKVYNRCNYYSTSSDEYEYCIQWTDKNEAVSFWGSGIDYGNLFELDNLKFRLVIYKRSSTFNHTDSAAYYFNVSDLNFEELQKAKLAIYASQEKFYNDLLENAPCELSSIEAHPRVINPNE
ncbi:hypothetical protein [Thomasclavelia spiroformis]|uniref:hypothetical protein n=1 Tax=Thomasclavelia spiroformis TaxID=29348 RepID=UPI00242002B9|nr:hypothetical protein [Thomasclavelia spiroformis]MBS6114954.1 hypothetical protein [Thomasclavelia spiroformis]